MNKITWSPDLTAILTEYYPTHGATVVNNIIRRRHGINMPKYKVIAKAKRMGISYQGPRKAWKKGNEPHNKGKKMPDSTYQKCARTMFRPGNKPPTSLYDGAISERRRHDNTTRHYIRINGKWKLLSHHEWEKHHGPIPPAHVIRFKDGDHHNNHIDNLELISRAELARLNYDENKDHVRRGLRISHANRKRGGLSFVDAVLQARI